MSRDTFCVRFGKFELFQAMSIIRKIGQKWPKITKITNSSTITVSVPRPRLPLPVPIPHPVPHPLPYALTLSPTPVHTTPNSRKVDLSAEDGSYKYPFWAKISFFWILANFDVIFKGEEIEISKVCGHNRPRGTPGLSKYPIRVYVALAVPEIWLD